MFMNGEAIVTGPGWHSSGPLKGVCAESEKNYPSADQV
jgi:hypothetical protein